MLTPSQIIADKGGPAVFAAAIGMEPGAVRMMKHRDKLPRSVWPEVQKAFPDLTLDKLIAAEKAGQATALRLARAG